MTISLYIDLLTCFLYFPLARFAALQANIIGGGLCLPVIAQPHQGTVPQMMTAGVLLPGQNMSSGVAPSSPVKICNLDKCNSPAYHRTSHCVKHSGSRRCHFEECHKTAQGKTRFCIAHGGGRRCTFSGCDKGARDKQFCAA